MGRIHSPRDRGSSRPIRTGWRRLLADQRIRFLLVGGANTAIGFVLFVAADLTVGRLLNPFGSVVASLATLIVSHLMAAVIAFILYRRFVFRVTGNVLVDFLRFESVYLLPLAANAVVLPALVVWGVNRIAAQAAIITVMTFVSYIGHRYFSFRRPAGGGVASASDMDGSAPEAAECR